MTMPHLMNCSHMEDGWCLACVKELWEEKEQRPLTIITSIEQSQELIDFAKRAINRFNKNAKLATHSDGAFTPGSFLALRWGLLDRSIMILKLDTQFVPVNFSDALVENSL